MGGHGCTVNGSIDDSKFNQPMPWIGIYVGVASAACALAMSIDAFQGFRYRKFWFPCKFFSLNATTLTLLSVATKLCVDLNTSMPQKQDQLAKLSSAVFICTVIANFVPSLGTTQTNELLMNLVALGIFVVTVIVNICIQLATGVIYVFWVEHAAVMFLMLVLLVILFSTSLTIPITKNYLTDKYSRKHKLATQECDNVATCICIAQKLKDDLARFWMMAHTSSPQFVVGRLATSTASGAVCVFSTLLLLEAMLRSYLMPFSFKFCRGESDYKWSSTLILLTQLVAIAIGSIAPASRWLLAINFLCPKTVSKLGKVDFNIENYWTMMLNQWKECPLVLEIHSRPCRKLVNGMVHKVLDLCIWMQTAIVVLSKIARLISIYFMIQLKRVRLCCNKLSRLLICKITSSTPKTEPESPGSLETNVRHYVLHLEGEERFIDVMAESKCDVGHFIRIANKKQPRHLIQLLEKTVPSHLYEGVTTFESEKVPSLNWTEPPNCWALPVVTLTSISLSLPQIDEGLVKELICSVNEALIFTRVVEQNLDIKGGLTNIRNAADIVWVGVDLHYKWLEVDLQKLSSQNTSPKEVLQQLSSIAKHKVTEFTTGDLYVCLRDTPSKWPARVYAANSMYRICQTLLMSVDSRTTSHIVFERVCALITDIVAACLTNLQNVITMKCHPGAIEEREKSVAYAIFLLGKTEKILRILHQRPLPNLKPDQLAYIDEWRAVSRSNSYLLSDSPTVVSDSTSGNSSHLYIAVE